MDKTLQNHLNEWLENKSNWDNKTPRAVYMDFMSAVDPLTPKYLTPTMFGRHLSSKGIKTASIRFGRTVGKVYRHKDDHKPTERNGHVCPACGGRGVLPRARATHL